MRSFASSLTACDSTLQARSLSILALPLTALLALLIGCQPDSPSSSSAAPAPAAATAQGAGGQGVRQCRERLTRTEGELTRLQALGSKADDAKPYRIINGHEHLMGVEYLDDYLAAARAAGIVSTVMVASPHYTIYGKGNRKGEPSMAENFEKLLEAVSKYPGEIIPFAGVDPDDPDKLERLKKHVQLGAKGVKLYSGHSHFYTKRLDAPDMDPVYAYIEQQGLPLCWHVNMMRYLDQFEAVMKAHPRLNVQVPHYGVLFWRPNSPLLGKLIEMMRTYPNMYIDTSLGTRKILIDGLGVMSEHRQVFIDFVEVFQDRITFGTDGVVTGNKEKTQDWWQRVIMACRNQLERDSFYFAMGAGFSKYWHKGLSPAGVFQGLGLSPEILRKIYEENPQRWLKGTGGKG